MRLIPVCLYLSVSVRSLQGSATLSMAYAAALFADACLRGMNGATATECTYVESEVTDLPFFATKVKLGTEGELLLHAHCFFAVVVVAPSLSHGSGGS